MEKNEEEFIKKYIKLSTHARILADSITDIDFNSFVEWWIKNRMIIGDAVLLEYLIIQKGKNDNKNK